MIDKHKKYDYQESYANVGFYIFEINGCSSNYGTV